MTDAKLIDIAERVARAHGLRNSITCSFEDMRSVALESMLTMRERYESGRGGTLEQFLWVHAVQDCVDYKRSCLGRNGSRRFRLGTPKQVVFVDSHLNTRGGHYGLPVKERDTMMTPRTSDAEEVEHWLHTRRLRNLLTDVLSPRDQLVVIGTHWLGLRGRDLAPIFNVTEQRISQIKKGSLDSLREFREVLDE